WSTPSASNWTGSIPFESPLTPFVDEADCQNGEENHHRPEAEPAHIAERYDPREEKGHYEVKNNEQDRYQKESDDGHHARTIKCIKGRLESRYILGIVTLHGHKERSSQKRNANGGGEPYENDNGQVIAEQISHAAA